MPPQRAVAEAQAATNERLHRLELRIVDESCEARETRSAGLIASRSFWSYTSRLLKKGPFGARAT